MARATTPTLLSLDRFAERIGTNPLYFNQVILPGVEMCGALTRQYSWQSAGGVGREDVARAIAQAEARIMDELGFPLMPTWITEENVSWFTMNPRYGTLIAGVGHHFIEGGVRAQTLIDADAGVMYSDEDGDGYEETATITAVTTVTDPEEIVIFYPGEDGADEWEIRPIKVTIEGGGAIITCRREQLVLPGLMSAVVTEGVDGTDDDNFLGEVAVYRRYNDPQQQVELMWANPAGCTYCTGDGCTACSYTTKAGCLRGFQMKGGLITISVGEWNDETNVFDLVNCFPYAKPTRLRMWYRAGFRDTRLSNSYTRMSDKFEQAVALLALTYLPSPLCGCLSEVYDNYGIDLANQSSDDSGSTSYKISQRDLESPFGTKRGAVEAWRLVRGERVGKPIRVH